MPGTTNDLVNAQLVDIQVTRPGTQMKSVQRWTDFEGESMSAEEEGNSGNGEFDMFTHGRRKATWKLSGLVGGIETPDELPREGDVITLIHVFSTNNEALMTDIFNAARYGVHSCTKRAAKVQQKGHMTWQFEGRSGTANTASAAPPQV